MMDRLFADIEPYHQFNFKVSPVHTLYVEEVGNPQGQPVVFLHGGPGAGLSKRHRRFFDPKHYRIILFDQRGAGQSTPHANLEDNTTWHLIADIEKIRQHLGIAKWMVFGGSWGSTLALAYAQQHPDVCTHLVLRGIFLCRPEEITWFYQSGAHHVYPDLWEDYVAPIPESERSDMVSAFYKRLTSDDPGIRRLAAKAWSGWEGGTLKLIPDAAAKGAFEDEHVSLSLARIECHYFMNNAFFKTDNWLIENIDRIRHIQTVIVHGRYDVVCPIKNAWDLHRAWPEAELQIIKDAGHAADEPGICAALVAATERFKLK